MGNTFKKYNYKLEELLKKYNIDYKKYKNIFDLALTHRSFGKENNERLEYLGDAVLELVITELLFVEYPEKTEGDLTSFRAALVKSETLSIVCQKLGINNYIVMSKSEQDSGGKQKTYILADVLEAFIAAIHLVGGYNRAKQFIKDHIYVYASTIVSNRLDIDSKSKLQEFSQEHFKFTPIYEVIEQEGPDHDKTFTIQCVIKDRIFGVGKGKSKQTAEQQAAKVTLDELSKTPEYNSILNIN